MASFSWAADISGDWNTGTLWTPASVPNSAAADVTIDAAATLAAYTVAIASGKTETVNSLSMNGTNNFVGSHTPGNYRAAELELDGTLVFAPGSAGAFSGSLQTYVHERAGASAAILNGGTLDAFIQAEGTLLLSGTNSVYISNELEALGGTVTIAAPIGNVTGSTLTDGIFNATGSGALIDLGSASAGQIINIVTIAALFGWTRLTFDGPTAAINEWTGSQFVSVETTLRDIGAGGTVDILGGQNFITNSSLAIDETLGSSFFGAAMLNLQAGTVAIAGGININEGIVQGYGTIASSISNHGTVIALGGTVNGTLDVTGSLTGTGIVAFDKNASTGSDPTEATLLLHSVSAGQTITLNDGGDTLILATPSAFAGTIVAGRGGRIILQGLTATSATLSNGTLAVKNNSQAVASLALAGSYAGDSFVASGSIVTIVATPTISGTTAGQKTSDQQTIAPFAGVAIVDTNFAQTETLTVTVLAAANGTLSNLGGGAYNAATGVYTVTGPASAVTAALAGLVFTPTPHQILPGLTVATGFTVHDIDTASKSATDSTTTVIATAGTVLPTISGSVAGQAISDQGTISPFANVTIADANFGQTEIVTVGLSDGGDGTLTNLGAGSYDAADGSYHVSGSASAVTSAVRGLVFIPTLHEVAPGNTIVTTFAIDDKDTSKQLAVDRVTTVITTAAAVLPTITGVLANQATSDLATISPFAHVTVADANVGQTETVTVTLTTVTNGTLTNVGVGTYNAATGVYTVTGQASAVTSALNALVFTPTPHQIAPGQAVTTGFTIRDTDTASQTTPPATTSVVATAAAVPLTISAGGFSPTIGDLATISPFTNVVIADVNFGQTETVTVTLSAAANGTLINQGPGTYDVNTGVYLVTGTADAVTAAVDALVFTPTAHQIAPGQTITTGFTIYDVDTASLSAIDTTRTIFAIADIALPTITGATAGQAISDQATISPLAGVTIGDVNFDQTETVTVTLSTAANGTLSHLGGGAYDPGGGVYTITGVASAVTSALDALVFTPTPYQVTVGQTVITRFTISDIDSALQTETESTTTVIATATATARPPTISGTVAGQAISNPGTISPFAHVVIADANVGQTETVTVTLSAATNGTLTNLGGGTYNAVTGVYTLTGGASAVTAALEALLFTPAQAGPGQSVTTGLAISDIDTASQSTTDGTTTVVATTAAVPPTVSGTVAGQAVSDQGTISPFAGISIADANVGQTETVTVALSAPANGTLTNLGGGTYNATTGVYNLTGTAPAVTTALNALVFTPTLHQVAPEQAVTTGFTIVDIDTASQRATDSATTVVATAVAVLPTISGTVAGQAVSDQATISPFAHVAIADANVGQIETVTVTLSAPANGTLTNLGGGTYNATTGVYSLTGTAPAVTTALSALAFIPALHQVAPGQAVTTGFAIGDIDTASQRATDSATTVVTTIVAVLPTISGTRAGQAISDQGTVSPLAQIVIADANFGQTETVTVTLSTAADGTLTNLGGGTYNATTGVYSLTGIASVVTTALNALVFTPTLHQVAPEQAVTTGFTIVDIDTASQRANDSATTVVATAVAVLPTISGTRAGQAISDQGTVSPLAHVVIADANFGQTETVTVTLSTAADGTLTNLGGGAYNPATGVYSLTGTVSVVTTALKALVFTPTLHQVAPEQAVTTGFTIVDIDTASQRATDSATTVVATAVAGLPTISGTVAGQAVSDQGTISPFAHVVIADANFGQTETVTVTLSSAANGTLINLGGGTYNATTGVYSVTGGTSAVTAALSAAMFVPTRAEVAGGQSVTTGFSLIATDTAGASTSDTTTTVVTTAVVAPPGEVMSSGSSPQYVIANDGGLLYIQDTVAGRNGTQILLGVTVMAFTDGVGLYDPTGTAEDVARLYKAALDRPSDVAGLKYWTGEIDNGNVSLSAVAAGFAASPEFMQSYGQLNNSGFVQQLYENVLGRPADAAGLQYWDSVLASGVTRGDVLLSYSESAEFKSDMLPVAGDQDNAEAYRLYTAALNRAPDATGQAYWASQLANGVTPTQVAQSFVISAEFIQDYGQLSASDFIAVMYENVLHRAADSNGQQYWTNMMLQGASDASVLLAFSDSVENRLQTASATHANWVFIPA